MEDGQPVFNKEDQRIKEAYITWRSNPANIGKTDQGFCSANSISIKELEIIKEFNPDIQESINSRAVTDDEMSTLLGLLTRLCYERAFTERIPVKSLEGLANALVNLMKQRQLESGRPTEIITIKEEELKKLTPQERYQRLLASLRRPSN